MLSSYYHQTLHSQRRKGKEEEKGGGGGGGREKKLLSDNSLLVFVELVQTPSIWYAAGANFFSETRSSINIVMQNKWRVTLESVEASSSGP